ncbi:type 1 glutamine amidotransferase [Filimonas zeae]|uniref:Glycosyl hydrolase n=1 Tax=Filimonas zeae TaxID=1737353 RepID=A0A917IY34_9BACT|nr:ThuA domain-containing protein [Filimonas zeae]MDR6339661.1 type 1 glutamine amidotransferase [Filimonas zeae]GGH69027.1 hypothetical protein GCM10011379_25910 [Filimonas zeae]
MKKLTGCIFLALIACLWRFNGLGQPANPRFRVLALYENGGHHLAYSRAARIWLDKLAADSSFAIEYINSANLITDDYLSRFQVFLQLDYPPYTWPEKAVKAFEQYIEKGKGGWIGFHHATLLGAFDGYAMWPWFSDFMGGIRFENYIPGFASGKVNVEDTAHPVMKGVPRSFVIDKEEWYTWNKSPRAQVRVLASVDEATYQPDSKIKMGDHPVVWSNPAWPARNVYIFMGHAPELFNNTAYTTLFRNALFWAADKPARHQVHVNQVGWDAQACKTAIVQTDNRNADTASFFIRREASQAIVFSGKLGKGQQVGEWAPGDYYYQADFSAVRQPGVYRLLVSLRGAPCLSPPFQIADKALASLTIPSIIHYYRKQRANTPQEQAADSNMLLFGSNKRVDIRGGWCDASGDISKYFSHLAYTNFMLPQQIPLVTWSMINTVETAPQLLTTLKVKDSLEQEALWGADYLMRSLSPEGYFYMTVFSYFKKDPAARRIVGLLANSVTTADYQCAFREGGGMAIAALARVSRWKKHGEATAAQYLAAARRAFAHLLVNNTKYADDGRENILDDYCALMAATELWRATGEALYQKEARRRAGNLAHRLDPEGYFIANEGSRPFWHASDAGLPVVALSRYLAIETDTAYGNAALNTIRGWLNYQLNVTYEVSNPFGYARQTFALQNQIRNGFFIPHENESGWWWQGENARLGSVATALLTGAQLVYNQPADKQKRDSLTALATRQLDWILGSNPYSMCFLYGFGTSNVPYMASMYGHGSEKGGISNGITGKDGYADGSGIDYKQEAAGNEWRWTEQWIPHAAWFMQAVTALAAGK